MQRNFQTTRPAGNGANVGPGYPPNASWADPENITADDANVAWINFFEGGQPGDFLVASQFGFELPDFAVIDGVQVDVKGSNGNTIGDIVLSAGGAKTFGSLPQSYGGPEDLWGEEQISPGDINDSNFGVSIELRDQAGSLGSADVDFVEITVFWHVDFDTAPADVPTRMAYKTYSRDGDYLGDLPNVTSRFGFSQDKNSAG